jgi:hypothetical protein
LAFTLASGGASLTLWLWARRQAPGLTKAQSEDLA